MSMTLPRPMKLAVSSPSLELFREADGLKHSWSQGLASGSRWWLFRNGQAVAYSKTLTIRNEPPAHFRLVDIEIRPEAQGQGLLRAFVKLMEEGEQETLWTDGGFTAEGLRALSFLPLVPGVVREDCFRPQKFVTSWLKLQARP